jgi:hypothetical protein
VRYDVFTVRKYVGCEATEPAVLKEHTASIFRIQDGGRTFF